MTAAAPDRPRFCPWCAAPLQFEGHGHEPRYESLANEARARGTEPPPLPDRVEALLAGESYVGACPGCRVVSHVIGHRAQ